MSGRVAARILVALLGVALLAQAWSANSRWQASRIAAMVERLSVRATGLGQVPTRLIENNLERLREAEALDPTNVSLPMLRGSQYLLLGRPRPALRAYDRALEVEPRAELYLNRGRALRMAGDEEAAGRAFRTALLLDPNISPEARRYLQTHERRRRGRDRGAGAGEGKDET